jgi:hypothetical protein
MDQLQEMMESNTHLEKQSEVLEHIDSVSKFWSALSEEDRDYIHGCRYALEYQTEWKIEE